MELLAVNTTIATSFIPVWRRYALYTDMLLVNIFDKQSGRLLVIFLYIVSQFIAYISKIVFISNKLQSSST